MEKKAMDNTKETGTKSPADEAGRIEKSGASAAAVNTTESNAANESGPSNELVEFAEAREAEARTAPPAAAATGTLIAIPTVHGALHGQLIAPLGPSHGLVIIVQTGVTDDTDAPQYTSALASALREQGLTTFVIDLLTDHEAHFADPQNNVPLLTQRLLECLSLIKRQMRDEALPRQPIGLYGADHASPVLVRVASLRDHDIAAIVCRDGLIDLAGMLYLHTLSAPLLMLVADPDEKRQAANRRALHELSSPNELASCPPIIGKDAPALATLAQLSGAWFTRHLASPHH